jgi:hypothetical protein
MTSRNGTSPRSKQSQAVTEAALGASHPEVGIGRNNLGGLLQALGDLAGARTEIERALQTTEAAFGPHDSRFDRAPAPARTGPRQVGGSSGSRGRSHRGPFRSTPAAYGPDHPKVAADLEALAAVREQQTVFAAAAAARRTRNQD